MRSPRPVMTHCVTLLALITVAAFLPACPTPPSGNLPSGEGEGEGNLPSGAVGKLGGWDIDADGWLFIEDSDERRIIYVSTQGSDTRLDAGSSPLNPLKTVATALALMTAGQADSVLLKRGDEFDTNNSVKAVGVSKSVPALIGAYGAGPRPRLMTLTLRGRSQYCVVQDIHCVASIPKAYGSDHFFENVYTGGTDYLLTTERERSEFNGDNIVLSRCFFDDHYWIGRGFRSGLWLGQNHSGTGYLLNECFFDQNRHRELRADEVGGPDGNPHQMYIGAQVEDVIIQNSIAVRGLWEGIYSRATHATVTGNLTYDNKTGGIQLGGYLMDQYSPNGIQVIVENNVCIDDTILIHLHLNAATPSTCNGNLTIGGGIGLDGTSENYVGVNQLTISNNTIYDGQLALRGNDYADVSVSGTVIRAFTGHVVSMYASAVTWTDNQFYTERPGYPIYAYTANPRGWERTYDEWIELTGATGTVITEPAFVDSTRGMNKYLEEEMGHEPYANETEAWEAYIALAKGQDRHNWDPRLMAVPINAYIRAGFAVQLGEGQGEGEAE